MLVVADSSPLIVPIHIGNIGLLPQLFGTAPIPPPISAESRNEKRPVRLIEHAPGTSDEIPLLDPGEVAAINLALEIRTSLLLIDESMGRKADAARGINIAGTIGILEQAEDQQLLNRKVAYERIKETDFWISRELLDVRLRIHLERKKKP